MFNAFVERLSTTVPAGQHRDAFIAYAQGKIMRLAEELAEDANYARSCANMPPEEREEARRMLAAFMGVTVSPPDCQSALNIDPRLECAPWSGQDHAAVLTVCRAC
jgi:hypothetical protein